MTWPVIVTDPLKEHTHMTPEELVEMCGLIPWWFTGVDDEELSAEDIIDKNYIIPFSTNLMKDFEVTENHTLKYPEDSDLHPYVEFDYHDDTIRIYPYGITSITKDGDTKIARLD